MKSNLTYNLSSDNAGGIDSATCVDAHDPSRQWQSTTFSHELLWLLNISSNLDVMAAKDEIIWCRVSSTAVLILPRAPRADCRADPIIIDMPEDREGSELAFKRTELPT